MRPTPRHSISAFLLLTLLLPLISSYSLSLWHPLSTPVLINLLSITIFSPFLHLPSASLFLSSYRYRIIFYLPSFLALPSSSLPVFLPLPSVLIFSGLATSFSLTPLPSVHFLHCRVLFSFPPSFTFLNSFFPSDFCSLCFGFNISLIFFISIMFFVC